MNLSSKSTIKKLLKEQGLSPSKGLGQNFLIDKNALKKILAGIEPLSNYTALEIGPGLGAITQALAPRAGKIIAIEKDPKLIPILKKVLEDYDNVEIVQKDILKFNPADYKLQAKSYKLIGNLPFYLTAPVIRKFLECSRPPKEMVLVVQKEMAQRITARPPKMNLLAISVQFYVHSVRNQRFSNGARPRILGYISKKSFWPSPKVDSAILKIDNIISMSDPRRRSAFNQRFFAVVKKGFAHPRKKLVNNLAKGLAVEKEKVQKWLKNAKIEEQARAENLSVENWLLLAKIYPKVKKW